MTANDAKADAGVTSRTKPPGTMTTSKVPAFSAVTTATPSIFSSAVARRSLARASGVTTVKCTLAPHALLKAFTPAASVVTSPTSSAASGHSRDISATKCVRVNAVSSDCTEGQRRPAAFATVSGSVSPVKSSGIFRPISFTVCQRGHSAGYLARSVLKSRADAGTVCVGTVYPASRFSAQPTATRHSAKKMAQPSFTTKLSVVKRSSAGTGSFRRCTASYANAASVTRTKGSASAHGIKVPSNAAVAALTASVSAF